MPPETIVCTFDFKGSCLFSNKNGLKAFHLSALMDEYPLNIVSHLQATHRAVAKPEALLAVAPGTAIPSKKALRKILNEIIFNPRINSGR